MKRFALWILAAAIAAATVTLVAPATAVAEGANADAATSAVWGEITGDGVRVRAGASQNYKILGVAKRGDRVVVIGEKAGWARIQANGQYPCWISAKYVTRNGDSGTVTGDRVNLRLEARAAHLPLGQANEGDVVRILESRNGWHRIVPPVGVSVWIHGEYVRNGEPVTRAEFAAWMGGSPVPEVSEPPAGEELVSEEELAAQRKQEQERKTWQELVNRFDDALARAESDKPTTEAMQAVERLAKEFAMFADVCETPDIAASANRQSRVLDNTARMMKKALDEVDAERQRLAEERLKAKAEQERLAELERKAKEDRQRQQQIAAQREREQKLNERKQLMARLLYVEPEGYTASGMVTDIRDSRGRQTFLLETEDGTTYELRLTPATRHVNLARLWQRGIGVRGRIVTIEGERWPVLVCDQIDPR